MEIRTTIQSTIQPAFSLKKLKGIKPKGVKVKNDPIAPLLVALAYSFADEFLSTHTFNTPFSLSPNNLSKIYVKLYEQNSPTLDDIDYTEEDLNKTIQLLSDSDMYDKLDEESIELEEYCKSRPGVFALGIYSSILLDKLTEKNKEKGESTKIHVAGDGTRFDFLFSCAENIDELIIENFKGNCIGSCIGGKKGNANTLQISNCEGNNIGTAIGNVDSLIIANNSGNRIATHLGTDSRNINSVLIAHNFGFGLAYGLCGSYSSIARYFSGDTGVNFVMIANNSIPFDEFRTDSKKPYVIGHQMMGVDTLMFYGNNAVLEESVASNNMCVNELISDEEIAKYYFSSDLSFVKDVNHKHKIKQILDVKNLKKVNDLQETIILYEKSKEIMDIK